MYQHSIDSLKIGLKFKEHFCVWGGGLFASLLCFFFLIFHLLTLISQVRSFGTEDRPTDRPVLPRDEVFEYIIFRGSDIEDLHVCEPYPAQKQPNQLPSSLIQDPAIVKTSAGPLSAATGAPAVQSTSQHAPAQPSSVVVGSVPSVVSSSSQANTVGQQVLAAVSVGSQRRSPTADSSVQVDSDMNYNRQQQQRNRQPSNDHYNSSSSRQQQQSNDNYNQRNTMSNQRGQQQQQNGHNNYDNNNRSSNNNNNNRMNSGYGQQQQQQNDYRRDMNGGLNDRNNLGGGNYNQNSQSNSNGFRRKCFSE